MQLITIQQPDELRSLKLHNVWDLAIVAEACKTYNYIKGIPFMLETITTLNTKLIEHVCTCLRWYGLSVPSELDK